MRVFLGRNQLSTLPFECFTLCFPNFWWAFRLSTIRLFLCWNIVMSRSNGLRLLPLRGVIGSTPKAWPETTDVSMILGKITVVGSVYSKHQNVSLRNRKES